MRYSTAELRYQLYSTLFVEGTEYSLRNAACVAATPTSSKHRSTNKWHVCASHGLGVPHLPALQLMLLERLLNQGLAIHSNRHLDMAAMLRRETSWSNQATVQHCGPVRVLCPRSWFPRYPIAS